MPDLATKFRTDFNILHRSVLIEAWRRGLNFQQIAEEFNARQIPRHKSQTWTRLAVYRKWVALGRPARESQPEPPQKNACALPNGARRRKS
jgi:hypothetical protein